METSINNIESLPIILTAKHLMKLTGLSRATTYELMHRQGFPMVRFGRALRVPLDAFLKWLEAESSREQ